MNSPKITSSEETKELKMEDQLDHEPDAINNGKKEKGECSSEKENTKKRKDAFEDPASNNESHGSEEDVEEKDGPKQKKSPRKRSDNNVIQISELSSMRR